MYFYKNLYLSDNLSKKKNRICWNIKHNRGQLNVYVIAVAYGKDLFEIYHSATLMQKGFPKEQVYIMGFASSNEEAMELLTNIVKDFMKRYDTIYFKEAFLQEKEQLFKK